MSQPTSDPKFFIGEPVQIVFPEPAPADAQALNGVRTQILAMEYFPNYSMWGYLTTASPPAGYFAEVFLRPLPGNEPAQWDARIFQPRDVGVLEYRQA